MGACAAGELCARYLLNHDVLPPYAEYLHPERYQNERIAEELERMKSDGQL